MKNHIHPIGTFHPLLLLIVIAQVLSCTSVYANEKTKRITTTDKKSKTFLWSDLRTNDLDATVYGDTESLRIADNILLYQRISGGWQKKIDMVASHTNAEIETIKDQQALFTTRYDGPNPTTLNYSHKSASFDEGEAPLYIRYLLRVAEASQEQKYIDGFQKGLSYLLEAQYPTGGWPQAYPHTIQLGGHVTFNDGAMISVMHALDDMIENTYSLIDQSKKEELTQARTKGIDFIVQAQIRVKGVLTAWCAQHDPVSYAPRQGRIYELPSISGNESVGIVKYLISIENPSMAVQQAIHGAIAWFRRMKIEDTQWPKVPDASLNQSYDLTFKENPETIFGFSVKHFTEKGYDRILEDSPGAPPLWARFYELENSKPLFAGWDGLPKTDVMDIDYERRVGYSWYGTWARSLIGSTGNNWKAQWPLAKPTLTLKGSSSINIRLGATFTEPGFNATDGIGSDIISDVAITGTIDSNVLGEQLITYNVTDYEGQQATSKTRSITVVNTAGFHVSNDLMTLTENGTSNIFTMVLTDTPTKEVILDITSVGTGFELSKPSITFTPENALTPQSITVNTIDDQSVISIGGTISVTVRTASSEVNYKNLPAQYLTVNITEDDVAELLFNKQPLIIEGTQGVSIDFVLTSQPATPVLVNAAANHSSIELSTSYLTFDKNNWQQTQTLYLTGVGTTDVSSQLLVTVAATSDHHYVTNTPYTIEVSYTAPLIKVIKDDTKTLLFSKQPIAIEGEKSVSIGFTLTSQPTTTVAVEASIDHPSLTLSTTALIFDQQNWHQTQSIQLTGVGTNALIAQLTMTATTTPNQGNILSSSYTIEVSYTPPPKKTIEDDIDTSTTTEQDNNTAAPADTTEPEESSSGGCRYHPSSNPNNTPVWPIGLFVLAISLSRRKKQNAR